MSEKRSRDRNHAVSSGYPSNEAKLVRKIVDAVRSARPNAWFLKVHGDGYQRPGIPDLLFVIDGRLLAVEVKHRKPGESVEHMLGRVSPAQTLEIDSLNAAGALATVAWEVEHVLDAVEELEAMS